MKKYSDAVLNTLKNKAQFTEKIDKISQPIIESGKEKSRFILDKTLENIGPTVVGLAGGLGFNEYSNRKAALEAKKRHEEIIKLHQDHLQEQKAEISLQLSRLEELLTKSPALQQQTPLPQKIKPTIADSNPNQVNFDFFELDYETVLISFFDFLEQSFGSLIICFLFFIFSYFLYFFLKSSHLI